MDRGKTRGVIHFFGLLVILVLGMVFWMLRDWDSQVKQTRNETEARLNNQEIRLRALENRLRTVEAGIQLLSTRPDFQPQPPSPAQ